MIKPKCPNCKSKKYINTMIKHFNQKWYLCSKCSWNNFKEVKMEEFEEFNKIRDRFRNEKTKQDKKYFLDGINKLLSELYRELEED